MTYDRQPAFNKVQPADEPWTADRLRKLVADIPPDPLNGATVLYVHPDRHKDAIRIKEAREGGNTIGFAGRLHIQLSRLASPNVIAGFKGDECVAIIRTEKDQ